MKKKILIVAVVLMLVVSCIALVACKKNPADTMHPSWAYDMTVNAENADRAEGSNVRIMSYNLLVDAWGGKEKADVNISNPILSRVEQVKMMLEHYAPDVIATQEMCEKWHGKLPKAVKDDYTIIFKGMFEYTSMMYNHNTVKLVEKGKVKFTKRSESKMRYSAWALFEKIDGGEKFIVINSHFDFGPDKHDMQVSQMEEFGDLAKELSEKYEAPVFLAGDYNCYDYEITDEEHPAFDYNQGVDLYKKFADDYKDSFKDSNKIDPATGIEYVSGKNRAWNDPKWDHIFVSNDVEVKRYAVLSNDYYTTISDHYAIYVDAAI